MSSTIRVRRNGQAELRENLRAAIKQAGLSQAAAASSAGVRYTHLVGGLAGNTWLTREAVDALAAVLEVSTDELVGNSIFQEQRDRYAAFDDATALQKRHQEERRAEVAERTDALAEGSARALCCECGSLRTCSLKGIYPRDSEGEQWGFVGSRATGRYLRTFKCFTCNEPTRHAILRNDAKRDVAEEWDYAPTRSDVARTALQQEIARLAGFNVEVHFRRRGKKNRERGYAIGYDYDESKSVWRIEIDPNLPPRAQLEALKRTWSTIAQDDFGDISWNPRTTGTLATPGAAAWEAATDDLMVDLNRFLAVERRRLLYDVREANGLDMTADD